MATAPAQQDVRPDKILLEVVTPRGAALSAQVDEVTAPSVKGEFGVLPGHLPLLAALRTGIVSLRTGSETKRVAIGAGFAEAGANKLLILTEEFVERSGVDPVLVRKELGEVQDKIAKTELASAQLPAAADGSEHAGAGDLAEERRTLIQRENWLAVQLELYGDPPPATMRPHEEFGPTPLPEDEDQHA